MTELKLRDMDSFYDDPDLICEDVFVMGSNGELYIAYHTNAGAWISRTDGEVGNRFDAFYNSPIRTHFVGWLTLTEGLAFLQEKLNETRKTAE